MTKLAIAIIAYAVAFALIYAGYVCPGYEEVSTGFPHTDAGYMAAELMFMGMSAKLAGHVFLFRSGR